MRRSVGRVSCITRSTEYLIDPASNQLGASVLDRPEGDGFDPMRVGNNDFFCGYPGPTKITAIVG